MFAESRGLSWRVPYKNKWPFFFSFGGWNIPEKTETPAAHSAPMVVNLLIAVYVIYCAPAEEWSETHNTGHVLRRPHCICAGYGGRCGRGGGGDLAGTFTRIIESCSSANKARCKKHRVTLRSSPAVRSPCSEDPAESREAMSDFWNVSPISFLLSFCKLAYPFTDTPHIQPSP